MLQGDVCVLTIIYLVTCLAFGGASWVLFLTMKNAARDYQERLTFRLGAATLATALLSAVALGFFASSLGLIT